MPEDAEQSIPQPSEGGTAEGGTAEGGDGWYTEIAPLLEGAQVNRFRLRTPKAHSFRGDQG